MAYEDLTTFTEYDGGSYVTVISTASLQYSNTSPCNNGGYILKDYGWHHFLDCELDSQFKIESVTYKTHVNGKLVVLGLAPLGTPAHEAASLESRWFYGIYPDLGGLCAYVQHVSTGPDVHELRLSNRVQPANSTDSYSGVVIGNDYYLTLDRSVVTAPILYIYSDAARTVLVDSLTVTAHSSSYRWLYACSAAYYSCAQDRCRYYGYVKNIEIVSNNTRPMDTGSTSGMVPFNTMTTGVADGASFDAGTCTLKANEIRSWLSHCDKAYFDYPVGYFSGDYYFYVNSIVTDINCYLSGGLGHYFLALNQGENCPPWSNNGEGLYYYTGARVYIEGATSDYTMQTVANNYYYFFYYRDYGTNTIACEIYMDEARTDLLDTITATGYQKAWYRLIAMQNTLQAGVSFDIRDYSIEYLRFLAPPSAPTDPGIGGPTDVATNGEFPTIDLYVTLPDDNDDCTVYFYDANDDSLIGSAEGTGGMTVSVPWNDLDCEETYSWYIVIDNGFSTATSSTWTFTCGSCDVFTIASESHPTIHFHPPKWAGENRNLIKDLQSFNFWSDDWAVHDNGVRNEPLTLSGIEWIDDDGDLDIFHAKFNDIHDIMNLHEEVAISGLGDCVDGYYYIKRFSFRTVPGCPRAREWTLELEFSREKTW